MKSPISLQAFSQPMPYPSVPFFGNTSDNTHCFQASFRMVLKYFLPERDFSWQELETLSAKVPGMSTWPQAMLLHLRDMGFEAELIEGFDAQAFVTEGAAYLRQAFGSEVAEWQIANSDLNQERRLYQKLLDARVAYEMHIPTLHDIHRYLADGWLVIVTVNSAKLNDRPGYAGHAVVVYGANDQEVTLHDPGLPPRPSRTISNAAFEVAWADPNDDAKSLIAIRKPMAK